jgi:hypothetical protein
VTEDVEVEAMQEAVGMRQDIRIGVPPLHIGILGSLMIDDIGGDIVKLEK